MADHKLFQDFATVSAYTYGYYDTPVNSPQFARTSASVAVVSIVTAGDGTFFGYGVGDLLYVRDADGSVQTRRVAGVASVPDAVSVNAAVSIGTSGRAFSFQRWQNGTSAADKGWFFCGDAEDKSVLIVPTTIGSTSVEYTINGDVAGQSFVIASGTIAAAAAGTNIHIPITENVRRLQIGLKQTGVGVNVISAFYRAKPKEARP